MLKGRNPMFQAYIGDKNNILRRGKCLLRRPQRMSLKTTKSFLNSNDSILSINSCTNINTILKGHHIHKNPPMFCLHSIYTTTSQGHSIPSYTNSLYRPYMTLSLHLHEGDSSFTVIPSYPDVHSMCRTLVPDIVPNGRAAKRRLCHCLGAHLRLSIPNSLTTSFSAKSVGSLADWAHEPVPCAGEGQSVTFDIC